MPRKRAISFLRSLVTDNGWLKLLSIVAAITLFSFVHGAEDAQRAMFVDVVAILPPADSGKVLISELPDQVKVTLRGSRSLIYSLRREELEPVQIDLSDTSLRYYYFDPAPFEMPAGVEIVQLAPASIPLTWDEQVDRRLPVSVQLTGHLADGLSLVEPVRPSPINVPLRGPRSEVDRLPSVDTEQVDIGELGPGRHERRVRLERPPAHSAYGESAVVRVVLDVVPELAERRLSGLSVGFEGNARVQVRPSAVDVVLRGPPGLVEAVVADHVVPVVDVSDSAIVGSVTLPIILQGVPAGVDVARVEPPEVLVQVTRLRVLPTD